MGHSRLSRPPLSQTSRYQFLNRPKYMNQGTEIPRNGQLRGPNRRETAFPRAVKTGLIFEVSPSRPIILSLPAIGEAGLTKAQHSGYVPSYRTNAAQQRGQAEEVNRQN